MGDAIEDATPFFFFFLNEMPAKFKRQWTALGLLEKLKT